jgi:hypothetical protein
MSVSQQKLGHRLAQRVAPQNCPICGNPRIEDERFGLTCEGLYGPLHFPTDPLIFPSGEDGDEIGPIDDDEEPVEGIGE